MKKVNEYNGYLILICVFLFLATALFARDGLTVRVDTPEAQIALASRDISSLQQEILHVLQPRGIWIVTDTQVYNYNNITGWNLYENHQHLYDDLSPWLQEEEIIQRNTSGNWENYQHYLTTYVNESQMESYTIQNWQISQWQNYYRSLYQYNTSGILSGLISQMWQNNTWQNFSQTTYYYGTNNAIHYLISQTWQNNAWLNSSKVDYTYNIYGQISQMTFYYWSNNTWVLSSKMIYTYTYNDLYSTILTQIWNSASSSYINSNRATYTYDSTFGCYNTFTLYEIWQNDAWLNQMRMLYSYDSPGNAIESIRQQYNLTWQNDEKRIMEYYFLDVANDDDYTLPKPIDVTIAPNPSTTFTDIHIKSDKAGKARIEVFNIKGQRLINQDIQVTPNNETVCKIDTSSLASGIYFVKTSVSGQQVINRILKIK